MNPHPRRSGSPRKEAGFTIVELMIVVTIVVILGTLAAPSMILMIRNQRVKTASFDTFAGLVLARSEAIKRNTNVTITPTGSNWAAGWTTTDSNGNVVARQDPLTDVTLTGPATVTFNGLGRLTGTVTALFILTSTNLDASQQRCINIDPSGRPVSKQGAGATC